MRRTDKELPLNYQFCLILLETLVLVLALTGLPGCTFKNGRSSELREAVIRTEEETSSDNDDPETEASPQSESIYVYVCGEVLAPGVYELHADSRMFEAIEAAGGMTGSAARSYLNQAERLSDGQQVYVPSEGEVSVQPGSGGQMQEPDDGKVNLNIASKEELMTLSGIGEVKAEAIIRYREEKGGFTSVEELKEIEGIKDGVFNKVKDQIKI